jgi:hypothetical protein
VRRPWSDLTRSNSSCPHSIPARRRTWPTFGVDEDQDDELGDGKQDRHGEGHPSLPLRLAAARPAGTTNQTEARAVDRCRVCPASDGLPARRPRRGRYASLRADPAAGQEGNAPIRDARSLDTPAAPRPSSAIVAKRPFREAIATSSPSRLDLIVPLRGDEHIAVCNLTHGPTLDPHPHQEPAEPHGPTSPPRSPCPPQPGVEDDHWLADTTAMALSTEDLIPRLPPLADAPATAADVMNLPADPTSRGCPPTPPKPGNRAQLATADRPARSNRALRVR